MIWKFYSMDVFLENTLTCLIGWACTSNAVADLDIGQEFVVMRGFIILLLERSVRKQLQENEIAWLW